MAEPSWPDEYALRRWRLPVKAKAFGLRRRADVCDAAFVSTVRSVAPNLVDRSVAPGGVLNGFMHDLLAPVFGDGSFNDSNREKRFDHLLNSTSTRLGQQLRAAWLRLQLDHAATLGTPLPLTSGRLSSPVEAAGIDPVSG